MSGKFPGGIITAGAPAGYSVAFNGSTDYLTATNNAAYAFGTGDFCVEAWVYLTATPSGQMVVGSTYQSTSSGFSFTIESNVLKMRMLGDPVVLSGTTTVTTNAWHHIAVTRSGTSLKVFLDGAQDGTATNSDNVVLNSTAFNIARLPNNSGFLSGYISNLRVVKGSAVYTAAFTPPTQLFPIANTSLLTCQSPTIIDNSNNAFAITAVGSAAPNTFTPFARYTAGAAGFNPALGAAAPGVWTLDEAEYYQGNRKWPIYDPYFNQTTLMLHGNQPPGVTDTNNNTFKDSSSNNFTITRNGNTTQGTFTPFSQTGWSVYSDSSNYLAFANNISPFMLGANDFSLEAWVFPTTTSAFDIAGGQTNGSTIPGSSWNWSNNGGTWNVGSGQVSLTAAALPVGVWSHVAYVRTGGTWSMYTNGVRSATRSDVTGYTINTGATNIPNRISTNGYTSNARFIIGSGGYNANNITITVPPLAPLSATPNTQLLTCQSNRYVDNSAYGFAVTTSGTPSVQAFSPFVPTVTTPTTYSNWFIGSSSYLNLGGQTAFALGAGDFTIETWFNTTTTSATQILIDFRPASTDGLYPMIYIASGGGSVRYNISNADQITGTATISTYTWYHLALCKSGSSTKLFLNGVQVGSTYTDSNTYLVGANRPVIGAGANIIGATPLFGCLSNLRVVKGTAVYTTAFTPPTAPLTNITNTSLLTCQSSTLIDNSTNNFTITATGTVYPVTSPTPFAPVVDQTTLNTTYSTSLVGGSAYFDGSGDYLSSAGTVNWSTYTNLTVDFWYYPLNLSAGLQGIVGTSQSSGDAYTFIYSYADGRAGVGITGVNEIASAAGAIKGNTWQHVAVVKVGSTTTIYVNGVSVASGTTGVWSNNTRPVWVGYGASANTTGYISGMRLTLGSALYTSNFAPPVAPPTPVTNTQLLLNFTNAGIFDNTAKMVFETVSTASISATQSKYGGSSMSFNGTSDYLVSYNNVAIGTADCTIEAWIYPTFTDTGTYAVLTTGPGGTTSNLRFGVNTNQLYLDILGAAVFSGSGATISSNTWSHIAVARTGGTWYGFINGVQMGSTTTQGTTSVTGAERYVGLLGPTGGAGNTPGGWWKGYIDDLRVTQGVARYKSNFTPPTSQLQDQ